MEDSNTCPFVLVVKLVCFVYIDLLWFFAFTEFWSRNPSVKVYISNQMFYARVLCSRFRLKNWIVQLFSSFESRALLFSNYTSHDRHNCRPKKYFPRIAHVEIQIQNCLHPSLYVLLGRVHMRPHSLQKTSVISFHMLESQKYLHFNVLMFSKAALWG